MASKQPEGQVRQRSSSDSSTSSEELQVAQVISLSAARPQKRPASTLSADLPPTPSTLTFDGSALTALARTPVMPFQPVSPTMPTPPTALTSSETRPRRDSHASDRSVLSTASTVTSRAKRSFKTSLTSVKAMVSSKAAAFGSGGKGQPSGLLRRFTLTADDQPVHVDGDGRTTRQAQDDDATSETASVRSRKLSLTATSLHSVFSRKASNATELFANRSLEDQSAPIVQPEPSLSKSLLSRFTGRTGGEVPSPSPVKSSRTFNPLSPAPRRHEGNRVSGHWFARRGSNSSRSGSVSGAGMSGNASPRSTASANPPLTPKLDRPSKASSSSRPMPFAPLNEAMPSDVQPKRKGSEGTLMQLALERSSTHSEIEPTNVMPTGRSFAQDAHGGQIAETDTPDAVKHQHRSKSLQELQSPLWPTTTPKSLKIPFHTPPPSPHQSKSGILSPRRQPSAEALNKEAASPKRDRPAPPLPGTGIKTPTGKSPQTMPTTVRQSSLSSPAFRKSMNAPRTKIITNTLTTLHSALISLADKIIVSKQKQVIEPEYTAYPTEELAGLLDVLQQMVNIVEWDHEIINGAPVKLSAFMSNLQTTISAAHIRYGQTPGEIGLSMAARNIEMMASIKSVANEIRTRGNECLTHYYREYEHAMVIPTKGFRIEGRNHTGVGDSFKAAPELSVDLLSGPAPTSPIKLKYLNWATEHADEGAIWFSRYFVSNDYFTFCGTVDDEAYLITYVREETEETDKKKAERRKSADYDALSAEMNPGDESDMQYRVIVRKKALPDVRHIFPDSFLFRAPPSSPPFSAVGRRHPSNTQQNQSIAWKAILQMADPKIVAAKMKMVPLDQLHKRYKFGVLYVKEGQTREEEWFSNSHDSHQFDALLRTLGQRVDLAGYTGWAAGLDTKSGDSGEYTYFTEWRGSPIAFHVSTLIPVRPGDRQQIQRKRHIGNDIVCIAFVEKDQPFNPGAIKSQFLHVFIVVHEQEIDGRLAYRVEVVANENVPAFGPPLPDPPIFFDQEEFRAFMLAKMVNGENAALRSPKFAIPNARAREGIFTTIVDKANGMAVYPHTIQQPLRRSKSSSTSSEKSVKSTKSAKTDTSDGESLSASSANSTPTEKHGFPSRPWSKDPDRPSHGRKDSDSKARLTSLASKAKVEIRGFDDAKSIEQKPQPSLSSKVRMNVTSTSTHLLNVAARLPSTSGVRKQAKHLLSNVRQDDKKSRSIPINRLDSLDSTRRSIDILDGRKESLTNFTESGALSI